jgi:hypothetical protein
MFVYLLWLAFELLTDKQKWGHVVTLLAPSLRSLSPCTDFPNLGHQEAKQHVNILMNPSSEYNGYDMAYIKCF